MNYPSIPTDNLYKFVALGGLALMFFSVTYPTSKALELRLSRIEVHAQIKKQTVELEDLERELTRVEEKEVEHQTEAEVQSLRQALTVQKIKGRLQELSATRLLD